MNYIYLGVILAVVTVLMYYGYTVLKFKKHTTNLSNEADSIMSDYIEKGKDKIFKELSTEELLDKYKQLLSSDLPDSTEDIARHGVEEKIMQDELTSRGIDVVPILNGILEN